MNTITKTTFTFVMAAVWCMMFSTLQAGEPTARELDAAIKSGDFASYQARAAAWLNQKAPAKPSETALQALLKDDGFRTVLAQWQLIAKLGVEKINAFAKAGGKDKEFLTCSCCGRGEFQVSRKGGLSDSGVWKLWNVENVMLEYSGPR